jgi:hypothetical protein
VSTDKEAFMSSTISAQTLALTVAGFFVFTAHLAAQTTQEPSMADAARIAREQRKSAAQPGKVITNDTLSPTSTPPASLSTAATSTAQVPDSPDPSASPSAQAAAELSPGDAENLKKEIVNLKAQLKDEQGEVDLLKHLLALDKESYYSKTDYVRDTDGKAKLDSLENELKQKEEEFAKLKAKLESLASQEIANPTATSKP